MSKTKGLFLAEIVSRVFGTPWLAILILASFYWSQSLRLEIRDLVLLAVVLILNFFIPLVFFLDQLRSGKIAHLDAPNRSERLPLYTLTLVSWTTSLFLVKLLGYANLFGWLRTYYFLVAALVLMTFFYKVSVHAALNTAVLVTLIWVYGWAGIFYAPIVVLVAWSRIVKGVHRVDQLAAGVLVGLAATSLGFLIQ